MHAGIGDLRLGSIFGVVWLGAVVAACDAPPAAAPGAVSPSLSETLADLSYSSGTVVCVPTDVQLGACDGAEVGDECTLVADDGTPVEGTCLVTLDGTGMACAPEPKAAPAELAAACRGLASGAACQSTDPLGTVSKGVCAAGPDGTTLLCGRATAPSTEALNACRGLSPGEPCKRGGVAGLCAFGPGDTGALACAEPSELLSQARPACAGLSEGASCKVGKAEGAPWGTCVVPETGGAPMCLVPCFTLGGRLGCTGGGGMGRDGGLAFAWPDGGGHGGVQRHFDGGTHGLPPGGHVPRGRHHDGGVPSHGGGVPSHGGHDGGGVPSHGGGVPSHGGHDGGGVPAGGHHDGG